MVAQHHGIRERSKRQRVLNQTRHAIKIRHAAEGYNKVIVLQLKVARTEPRTDSHDLVLEIDILDIPHHQIGSRAKTPNRGNHVGESDGTGNHLRQHRLIDPVVLSIDESDARFFRTEKLLEIAGRVYTSETATQNEDLLRAHAHNLADNHVEEYL